MTQLASHALATCKSPGFTCSIQPAARPHEFLVGDFNSVLHRDGAAESSAGASHCTGTRRRADIDRTCPARALERFNGRSTKEKNGRRGKKEPAGYIAAAFALPVWIFMSAVTAFSQCNYFALLLWPCLREKWFQRVTEEAHRHSARPTYLPAHQENTAHHMHFGSRSSSTTT